MQFIYNRDRVIASTSGHSVEFKKGVPTFVPPAMRDEVFNLGAAPATPEEIEAYQLEVDEAEARAKGEDGAEPTDPAVRKEKINAAFATIVKRAARDDFSAGGKPNVASVAAITGWKIGASERDEVWQAYIESQSGLGEK